MRGSSDDQAWIFANIAFYPPLTALMAVTKYTGHLRRGLVPKPRVGVIGAVKVKTTARTAVWTTAVYGIATVFFTFAHNWLAAGVLLVIGGICNLAAMSITQTVVQLLAPRVKRGQVVGVYGVAANGLRMGSGVTVGFLGGLLGLRMSLAVSAAGLVACTVITAVYLAAAVRRQAGECNSPSTAA